VPEKRPVGWQTLLTPERQQTIVSYIRAGTWDYVAAMDLLVSLQNLLT
jgi:hypothetical protein